jgi:hypothetical protein
VHSKANPLGVHCFYCYDALLNQPNGRNFAQRLGSRTSQEKGTTETDNFNNSNDDDVFS